MIENLKKLSAYTCSSKLFGKPMRGYDGQCESDPTRLKKGIRSNHNLTWHEAWYRAFNNVGLLDVFRTKAAEIDGNISLHPDAAALAESQRCVRRSVKLFTENAQQAPHLYDHYMRQVRLYEKLGELYSLMEPLVADVQAIMAGLPLNRSKLVDWKNIDSVQFYRYDAQTNSFVEFDHKVK